MNTYKNDALKGLHGSEYRKAWNKLHPDVLKKASFEYRSRNPLKSQFPVWLKLWSREPAQRQKQKCKYYSGWDKAQMRLQPWDDIDDFKVLQKITTDRQLGLEIGRSINAIQKRRHVLLALYKNAPLITATVKGF